MNTILFALVVLVVLGVVYEIFYRKIKEAGAFKPPQISSKILPKLKADPPASDKGVPRVFPKASDLIRFDFDMIEDGKEHWLKLYISNTTSNSVCNHPILLLAIEKCPGQEIQKMLKFILGKQGVKQGIKPCSKKGDALKSIYGILKSYDKRKDNLNKDLYIIDANQAGACEKGCKLPDQRDCYCIDMVESERYGDEISKYTDRGTPPVITGLSFNYQNGFSVSVNFKKQTTTWTSAGSTGQYTFGPGSNPYLNTKEIGRKIEDAMANASKDIYIVATAIAWRILYKRLRIDKYVHLLTNDILTTVLGLAFGIPTLVCKKPNYIPANPYECKFWVPKTPL